MKITLLEGLIKGDVKARGAMISGFLLSIFGIILCFIFSSIKPLIISLVGVLQFWYGWRRMKRKNY